MMGVYKSHCSKVRKKMRVMETQMGVGWSQKLVIQLFL